MAARRSTSGRKGASTAKPRRRPPAKAAAPRKTPPKPKKAAASEAAHRKAAPKKAAPKESAPRKAAARKATRARPAPAPPALRRESASRPPLHATSPASAARRQARRSTAAELEWDDGERVPPFAIADDLVQKWVRRGEELLAQLRQHGAAKHEYRADLKDGRFVWIAPDGRVSAEAKAQVVCSWSRTTSVVVMAWADALVRPAGIARVDGMPSERDDADEETAWRVAMAAADACGAAYLYRVPTPHAWYFVALRDLTFTPEEDVFVPAAPVGLVLRGLADTRIAIASRAEPADVLRERLTAVGDSFLHQAEYAYRGTDWVARLERTGRRMMHLAGMVARPSYGSIAAGRPAEEWLDRDIAVDLIEAITMLEDEWSAFA